MLNEKKYKCQILWVIKVGLQANIQLSKLKSQEKKKYYKKALQSFYGQKDHLLLNTGQEK